ncbi:MAG: hypothetical protein ACWA5P_00315 [bacterium]
MSGGNRPYICNKPSPFYLASSTDRASYAEVSDNKSICASCEVGAMVVYDNEYATPVWGIKHNLHIDDEEVISKVALSSEEVTPLKMMGTTSYKYEPSFFPPTKIEIELVDTKPMTIKEINSEQEKIYTKIDNFYVDIERLFHPWTEVWKVKGWSSVPDAYQAGGLKGFEAWKNDEIGFWKSLGGAIEDAGDATATYLVDKANNGPLDRNINIADNFIVDALEVPVEGWILIINMAYGITSDVIEEVSDGFNVVVNYLDSVMDFLKALATGSADGMMKALESLGELERGDISEISKEIFEALKDATHEASKGLSALLELMGRTAVVERLAVTLGSIVLLMTPNFLAEMAGTVAGYVIPTIIAGVIFTIIAALLSAVGVGEALFASRIAKYMKDLKAILNKLKNGMGAIFIKIFNFIEEIFGEIGKFLKKLMEAPTNLTMHPSNKKYTGVRSGHIGGNKKIVFRKFELQDKVKKDIAEILDKRTDTTHLGIKKDDVQNTYEELEEKIKNIDQKMRELQRSDLTKIEKKIQNTKLKTDRNIYVEKKKNIETYKQGVNRLNNEKGVSRTVNTDGDFGKPYLNIYVKIGDMNGSSVSFVMIKGEMRKALIIDNLMDYMKDVKALYKRSGNDLSSEMEKAIINHIKKYERMVDGQKVHYLNPRAGNPGLHAEVQAMNAATKEQGVALATHRLVDMSKGKVGSKFPACVNCTGILDHFSKEGKLQITTDTFNGEDIFLPK